MKHRRFRVQKELINGRQAAIVDPGEIRHITRVMRLGVNDRVTLFDGEGNEFSARIHGLSPERISFTLLENPAPAAGESHLRIVLGTALLKSSRFEWLLQKATELGVSEIVPFYSARVVPLWNETRTASRQNRWRKIMAEAAKQCRRARVPDIHEPESFETALGRQFEGALKIFLWEREETNRLGSFLGKSAPAVFALVGPEGGFSDAEADQAIGAGFHPVGLGPRVLRAETAGILVVGLLQFMLGDLRE